MSSEGSANNVYNGVVSEISETAEFTPRNVQTREEAARLVFQVKVDVPNAGDRLKPGMPVDAIIHLR